MEEDSKKQFENSSLTKSSQDEQPSIPLEEKDLKVTVKEEKPLVHSEEELLGSVSTPDCPGVRTSARFIQKQKDSLRPVTPPPTQANHSDNNAGTSKNRDEKSVHPKTPSQGAKVKVVWSNLEKSLFFDALNEFGKDFDAIANFINSKLKRQKTDVTCKSKEQIRATYYTTFHKISKFIKFSEEVKKPVQELYALINYGEMRRKLQFISEKNCMKIRELVYQGHVTFRHKGKNIRIRTPPCKALRKLNQIEDWLEDIKLPPKVDICLRPINMEAFGRVQSVAQNPYVKTSVPLQKKVVNILRTFQVKWRTQESKMINESSKLKATTNDLTLKENLPSEAMLHLTPHGESKIHRPLVNITQFLSSLNICLNSYENRIGVKVKSETIINDLRINNTAKRSRCDSNSEKRSPESKKLRTDLPSDIPLEVPLMSPPSTNQITANSGGDASESDEVNDELQDFLEDSIRTITASAKIVPPPVKKSKLKKQPRSIDLNAVRPLISDEIVNKIRKGWTILNAADITIGDLYCVFGQDSKLIFEYSWIDPPETNICDTPSTTSSSLSNKLKHLLLIANLQEQQRTNRLKKTNCFCGHVCDKSTILNNKTYIATKVFEDQPNKPMAKNTNTVFRQPMPPFRRPTFGVEGLKRMSNPRLKGRQVVVQRILPLHPDKKDEEEASEAQTTQNSLVLSTQIGDTIDLSPLIEISSQISIPLYSDENSSDSDIIPMSPSNILRDVGSDGPRWMDELSMSSLLGHLDELANTSDNCSTSVRSTDSSGLSIISETSVDYVTKFAELAAAEENNGL